MHLVCHIKEGQQVLALADVGDLAPLLLSGVNASGVVCTACMIRSFVNPDLRERVATRDYHSQSNASFIYGSGPRVYICTPRQCVYVNHGRVYMYPMQVCTCITMQDSKSSLMQEAQAFISTIGHSNTCRQLDLCVRCKGVD